jgi:hypothetical protein
MDAPETDPREPYIPVRVTDIIDLLLREAGTPEHTAPSADDHAAFHQFAAAVAARVHTGFRNTLQHLKDAYAAFDPDSDTYRLLPLSEAEERDRLGRLFETFTDMLTRAGFHRMTRAEIEQTMKGASAWGVEMDVCWDVFERVEVFYRGRGVGLRVRRPWWRLFRTQEVAVPTFRRVVFILKQQPHERIGAGADTAHVFLKLFKDIPQMDIEMLLPGTRLRMPRLERGKLGTTAVSSIAYVAWKLSTFPIASLLSGSLLALYTPLALIVGYGYKTIYSYQVSRRTYMLHLTQSLYYQNLDTNAGVLHRLFDDAEEQELRQALLAYYFLWRFAGPAGWTLADLDARIEADIERRLGERVEIDTAGALTRLERFRVVQRVGERIVAVPVRQATALVEMQPSSAGRLPDRPSHWKVTPTPV